MGIVAVLDLTIGLALIYALLAIVVAGLCETISSLLKWRAKLLEKSILNLLEDDTNSSNLGKVARHPLVIGHDRSNRPSYVSSRNFASALFDVLLLGKESIILKDVDSAIRSLPDSDVKLALLSLLKMADQDVSRLRLLVETWFDDTMDRASGLYKRRTHLVTLAIGMLTAVILNIDSIDIARKITSSPSARAQIAAAAERFVMTPPGAPGDLSSQLQTLGRSLEPLSIQIGWTATEGQSWIATMAGRVFRPDLSGILLVLGWVGTALAVSLGAPFWFDLLKLVFNIRGTGPKPPRSDGTRDA